MPSAANASEDAGIATRARNRCSCRARQRAFRGFVLLSSLLLPAFVLAQSDARDRPGDFVINRPASLYSESSGGATTFRTSVGISGALYIDVSNGFDLPDFNRALTR